MECQWLRSGIERKTMVLPRSEHTPCPAQDPFEQNDCMTRSSMRRARQALAMIGEFQHMGLRMRYLRVFGARHEGGH